MPRDTHFPHINSIPDRVPPIKNPFPFSALSTASAMLFSSLMGIHQQVLASENNATDNIEDNEKILEEVLITGKDETTDPTEMNKKTKLLFSVAGAAGDPLQSIYALPGIALSNNDGPGGSEPVIRGSAPQDNAYFIDMVPATYIFHNFGNSIFDKNLISSFDLYPAAFSSQYGNATGGIIDVTLREPRNQDLSTTLHTSILSSGIFVESGLSQNQAFYASYRRSMMDQFVDGEDVSDDEPGLQIDQLPISHDYQLKYHWSINEENSLSLIAAGASDLIGATFGEGNNEVARDPDFAGPAAIDQGFDSQGIIWNWAQGDKSLKSIVTHISEKEKFTYGANQHEITNANRYLGRFRYDQSLNKHHRFTTGLSIEDVAYDIDINAKIVACSELAPDCSTVDAEFVSYKDTLNMNNYEFYIEDLWSLTDQHALLFGLHYSNDDYLNEGRVEPRFMWKYLINDTLSTQAAAGRYSQLPQLREIIDVLGNPELTTVKSDHYTWGISQTFAEGWRWNIDLYYKTMSDLVLSSELDNTTENYSNNATGKARGIEFLINKELTDRWYGWAALSLSKTDRTNSTTGETVKFEYDKPILFNFVANRMIGERWMIGFKWNYQSGGRYTPVTHLVPSNTPSVLEPVYGELNSEQYPDYHQLDFRAEYTRPKSWGYWKFYIDILNVYNRENVEEYDYAPNGVNLISPPPGYGENIPVSEETGEGIFPSIGFEIKF